VRPGLTPSKSYKEGRFGQPWLVGDTLNSGIGQGFTLASPLQLAVMTARIASGKSVEPRLVRARDGKPILQACSLSSMTSAALRAAQRLPMSLT